MDFDRLESRLRQRCGSHRPIISVRAPLRACPLGAHIDHQGGHVTGMALDRAVRLVATPRADSTMAVESLGFPATGPIDLAAPIEAAGDWADYLRAVAAELARDRPPLRGFDGVMEGDLVGMGVSSSAAVMVAAALALTAVNGIDLDRTDLARLVRRAENRFIGVASGLLDQSVILFARAGALTHIRCGSFSVESVVGSAAPDFRILIVFSGMSRELAGTGYNTRVSECREAAAAIAREAGIELSGDPTLGAIPRSAFDALGGNLTPSLRRRATHFFTEMDRVEAGLEAWRRDDLATFGRLMTESGQSSIINYECGTPPMVTLLEALQQAPGVFGARFSGAGFGGSCVALTSAEAADQAGRRALESFRRIHPDLAGRAHAAVCRPADGARVTTR